VSVRVSVRWDGDTGRECRARHAARHAAASQDRARAIYELAIAQPVLDMPEVLWKARLTLLACLRDLWAVTHHLCASTVSASHMHQNDTKYTIQKAVRCPAL